MKTSTFQSDDVLSGKSLRFWRFLQCAVWLLGFGIFLALIFFPKIGIAAFWNVLIPVAPALFVLSTGIWRNICPLATVAMFPQRLNWSRKKRIDLHWQGNLTLIGVALLFLIVPVRHLMLNFDALATAITLTIISSMAFLGGYLFESKSGWCSGICPVHPVERMYGQQVLFSPPNAHCGNCKNCVLPCPDSTPNMHPLAANKRSSQLLAANLITGGLPGFIIGWFHVPDYKGVVTAQDFLAAFALPWGGMAFSLGLYWILRKKLPVKFEPTLVSLFAAASVSAYYWYRIPALLGFGLFPGDGMLVDMRGSMPYFAVQTLQFGALAFFTGWLVLRNKKPAVWAIRPPYVKN